MLTPIHIKEGFRMSAASWKAKLKGFTEYKGNVKEIGYGIIDDCWNGKYFQTSTRNFAQFWTRDFGICVEALVKLGYRAKVVKTLEYALACFKKYGQVTTNITPSGQPMDCFDFGSDSLPLFLYSFRIAGARKLVKKNKAFFQQQVNLYFKTVFDRKTGLVRADKHFSSMRDLAKRKSSCYDNCMLYLLTQEIKKLGLKNPFARWNVKQNIMKTFWNGKYFFNDIRDIRHVNGDAQVFVFWTSVCNDKKKFMSCVKQMERAGLCSPWPLRYANARYKEHYMSAHEFFVKDYETNSIWMHLGLCYLDLLKKFDKKRFRKHLAQYERLVKKYKTFLEVYDQSGVPFSTPFYLSDEGMLWVGKLLGMKK